ncbi:MAG: 30S ribosomal protein S11 [Candidatus Cloacimonetes bacterium]|nr:30S ribosomal protein S11 [Candidatus Cloacimonadota bacterium]MBL7085540.1 30S ribosomal protein S11 [Candidatus Cloacimonadota bacterium]
MAVKKKFKKTVRKKVKLLESEGVAYIKSTFNNTIITITDLKGNVIAWSSCGKVGFKNTKKSTSYAAQQTSKEIANRVANMGIRAIHVRVCGPGSGRDSAVRSLQAQGLKIISIKDTTPIPHNGCRPPKKRRI